MATFTAGDVTATTIEGALLQVAQLMQDAEQTYTVPNGETRQNRVQVALNTDTKLATITATLPIIVDTASGGAVSITADEYTA